MFKKCIEFIRSLYPDKETIPLHEPIFIGKEKEFVSAAIDSTFVSSMGEFVDRFEEKLCKFTGAKFAIATVNGTSALHVALKLAGVSEGDEVITQAATFVGTANAIIYSGASPVFLDSDSKTLGLSDIALETFLKTHCRRKDDGYTYNKKTDRKIGACIPMHVFGHPVNIDKIKGLCDAYHIPIVEDAAESLGSLFQSKHTGTFGKLGILSFNGNKTITTGGGGAVLTDDRNLGEKAKHLTTTAKMPHSWHFIHDQIGFNYRLPNLNAALGCAQIEMLPFFLERKRRLSNVYHKFFSASGIPFVVEPKECQSNYWLNAIVLNDLKERDEFLEHTNAKGIMTRPMWTLIPKLSIYSKFQTDELKNARYLQKRIVNIPSSVIL